MAKKGNVSEIPQKSLRNLSVYRNLSEISQNHFWGQIFVGQLKDNLILLLSYDCPSG